MSIITVQQPDNTTTQSVTGTPPVLYELVKLPDDNIKSSGIEDDFKANPGYMMLLFWILTLLTRVELIKF